MKCAICKQRTAKRHCPGVHGYICTLCCGREREVTVDCPFECPYLMDAYRFEAQHKEPPSELAYASHEVTEDFLREHEGFIGDLASFLLRYTMGSRGTADADVRAVLDAMIRTLETLSTGIIYETLPEGLPRINFYKETRKFLEEWRKQQAQHTGTATLRDSEVLRALVFFARVAIVHDNGRPRGRSFIYFLKRSFPAVEAREAPSIIIP